MRNKDMIEDHYPIFKKIIDDFEYDKTIFTSNKAIMSYYPQLFLLAIVSTFEKEIKEKCNNIVTHPAIALTSFPKFNKILLSNVWNYTDEIYKKFRAREKNGLEILDASLFYDIFGGTNFKNDVVENFLIEKQKQIRDYINVISSITPLLGRDVKYDNDFAEKDDIRNRLNVLQFTNAEIAFLKLKLRRNRVAHNFLTGISDTFEDIKNLYYDAVLYVVAIKKTLANLSTI